MGAVKALNARRQGVGPHTVVLAHGFGTDQSVWDRFLPELAARHTVITYDLACAGTADPAWFDLHRHGTLEGHVEDLIEILGRGGVASCSFVGHSVSGMIGVLAAIKRPELFRRLIAIGASPRYIDDGDYRGGLDMETVRGMVQAIEAGFRAWARDYAAMAIDRPLDDPASQSFVASMLRMRPDIGVAMIKTILFSDHREALPECRVPVVLLQTKHDPAVPRAVAEYLRDRLPRSTLETIDTTGHLPHLSAPEATLEALLRHLP